MLVIKVTLNAVVNWSEILWKRLDWNRNLFITMYFEATTKILIHRLVNCGEMDYLLRASVSRIMLLWWASKLLTSLFHNEENSSDQYFKWNESPCSDPGWGLPAWGAALLKRSWWGSKLSQSQQWALAAATASRAVLAGAEPADWRNGLSLST